MPKLVATRNGAEIVRTVPAPTEYSRPDAATALDTRAVPITRPSFGEYTECDTAPTWASPTVIAAPCAGTSETPSSATQHTGALSNPASQVACSASRPVQSWLKS